jgi:hypothetical protein
MSVKGKVRSDECDKVRMALGYKQKNLSLLLTTQNIYFTFETSLFLRENVMFLGDRK